MGLFVLLAGLFLVLVTVLAFALRAVFKPLFQLGGAVDEARRAMEARAAEQGGGIQVKGGTKSERCPYCRDALDDAPVACAECMARHHLECWDEHRQCASCGHVERFGQVERTAGRARPDAQQGKG